jgi:hypothetical protein
MVAIWNGIEWGGKINKQTEELDVRKVGLDVSESSLP